MKHKLNEEILMAYLYGECSAEERLEVEKFFAENPEELKEYQDILFVKDALGRVSDKEVIAPPIFMDHVKPTVRLWQSGFIRYSTGIAAAFLIVMIGAKLLGLQMNYSDNQFTISFGETMEKENPSLLSEKQVQDMIDQSLSQNNRFVKESIQQSQEQMSESLKSNSRLTSQKINEINKTAASESQEEIRRFMVGLQNQNNQIIQDYMRLSSNQQKEYIEGLLVDFSKYLQEQRNQDLNVLQTRLNDLEQDNNLFRQEAGQILTSLISNDNSSIKRN